MSQEVELKLRIAPADTPRVLDHPFFKDIAQGEFRSELLVSVYYDTPQLDLKRQGITLRLRQQGSQWMQTVKAAGKVAAGLHERVDEEWETDENQLNFAALGDSQVRDVFADEQIRGALRPLFVTEVTRTSTLLVFANGDRVEVAVDEGAIRAGEQILPVCEVELEHKAGHASRVFEVALSLQNTIPLAVENVSKAERGYRLATQAVLTPSKAKAPPLKESLSASEAFGSIMHGCLAHLQANEEGGLQGKDPEFVHQMRVALRRMRSALSLFKDLIPQEYTTTLCEELRWLTGELDAARNWDVFYQQTLPPILAAFPDDADLQSLATQSGELRRVQDQRAQEAVRAPRYHHLLLQLGAWLYTQPWRTGAGDGNTVAPELPIGEFAAQVLQKRHKKLRQRGHQLTTLPPPERHQVRIAAKKLRYATDFFAVLFPRKLAHRYSNTLAALQDVLGILNDAATAMALLQELAAAADNGTPREARGIVRGWVQGTSYLRLQELEHAWETFLDSKRFW
jgi:inorganic triphosphatase YgiF